MTVIILEDSKVYNDYLRKAEEIYPRTLNLELTSYCNLRCKMCPKTAGFHINKPDITISDEVLWKIIDDILPHVHHINLMGFGEPLIVKEQVLRLLEAAKRNHVTVNLITNGLLLDPETSKKLVELNLFNINISLDAVKEATYKIIRGGDFPKALENIEMLTTAKKNVGSKLPTIDLSFVGMVDNISELPEYVELAKTLGARKVVLQAMSEVPDSLVHDQDVFLRHRETGLKYYQEAKIISSRTGVEIELFPPDQFEVEREETQQHHKIPLEDGIKMIKDCSEPWHALFISSDGKLAPCCGLSGYGDLNKENFEKIWFGNKMKKLREKLKTDEIPQNCIYCRGAGWHKRTVLKSELIPGIDDRQLGMDWNSLEILDGEKFFWSTRTGTYFIADSGEDSMVEVEAVKPNMKLRIIKDNHHAAEFDLSAPGERDMLFISGNKDNGRQPGESVRKMRLEVDSAFVPASDGGEDGRELGVRFYGHREMRKIEFEDKTTLSIAFRKENSRLKTKNGYLRFGAAVIGENHNKLRLFFVLTPQGGKPPSYSGKMSRIFLGFKLHTVRRISSRLPIRTRLEHGDKLDEHVHLWKKKKPGIYNLSIGIWNPASMKLLKTLSNKNIVVHIGEVLIKE